MTVSTADLYDQHEENLACCRLQFRSYGGHRAFSGPVTTVRCHEDNALLKSVLSTPGNGGVLVIDGGGSLNTALSGDLIAQLGVDNGWAGIVINGAVRDVALLAEMPIGIRALGSIPRKSAKTGAGDKDVPVTFGEVTFNPGDQLTADDDGVVVLPA